MEFVDLLTTPSSIDKQPEEYINQIVSKYPWFYVGKLVALRHAKNNHEKYLDIKKSVQLGLNYRPNSKILLQNIDAEIFKKFESFDIIDSFLAHDNLAIGPAQTSDNEIDLSATASLIGDDLATESLAQIFVEQGHYGKAIEIYQQLSLKFPKKSAYFARLIEEINKKK